MTGCSDCADNDTCEGDEVRGAVRHQTRQEQQLSDDVYRAVLDSLEEQFALLDDQGCILFVNRSWRLFAQANGLSYGYDWVGQNYLDVSKAASQQGDAEAIRVVAGLEAVLSGQQDNFSQEYACHSATEQRWFILRVVPLQHRGGNYFVLSHQNITQRKQVEQAVEHSAQHDPLTGLANRRQLESFLNRSWRRGQRAASPLSLLMVDLDRFKELNDSRGHLEGDRALVRIASVLRGCAKRDTDLAARFGGDEFVLVLRDTDAEGASLVARKVIDRVAALELCLADGVNVGASVGVVTRIPEQSTDCDGPLRMLELADSALYQAKQSGRGTLRNA